MLLLLALFEQLEYVAGLGDSGEIELGLDLGLAGLLPRGRCGLCRKVLANPFSFILLNRT